MVQFLLTGPYGEYRPADGAEEQFKLVAVHKKLNLCYWIQTEMLGQLQEEMISVAACYTELKLPLQKSSLSKSPTKKHDEIKRARSAESYNDFRICSSCYKIKPGFPNFPEAHTPPLAVLTQFTVLVILSGTSLKWYGKLLVHKCNKYSSELILFLYRKNFHSAALSRLELLFSSKFSSHTWNEHIAGNVRLRPRGTWITTRTGVKSNSETKGSHCCQLSRQPSSTHLSVRAEGQEVPPKFQYDMSVAFPSRYFSQLSGLSAEKKRVNVLVVKAVS